MNNKYIEQTNNQTSRGGNNMFQTMKKRMKNEKGLTLIELLAVIVILAIIAAIAIPAIGNIITNSKYNAIKSDGLNILNAAQLAKTDGAPSTTGTDGKPATDAKPGDTITIEELKKQGYLENSGTFEDTVTVNLKTPLEFATDVKVEFESGKKIDFSGATVEDIKSDKAKGSAIAKEATEHKIKK